MVKCVSLWAPAFGPQKDASRVYELTMPNSRCMTT